MAERHMSVPKSLADRDVSEQFQSLKFVARPVTGTQQPKYWNSQRYWNRKPCMVIWLELAAEERDDVKEAKRTSSKG